MGAAKPTPGPWAYEQLPDFSFVARPVVVAGTEMIAAVSRANGAANARLIAAAPELLEALLKLEPYLSDQAQALDHASLNEGRASDWDVASIRARAAIARATGSAE